MDSWPNVTYIHVGMSLLFSKGSYTDDQLMNYKNLDCYQNFANEWVPKGGPHSHAISLFVEGSIELENVLGFVRRVVPVY